jgi:glucose/arabinose dehydrogenase
VAEGLEVPWEIAFMPDGRALVTERPGRIRMFDETLQDEPVAEVDVSNQGEGGLLGLALDPEFADNGLVYLYFTTPAAMKLERWQFTGDGMRRETDLIDGTIQAGTVHDSGRIAFGPDDNLYVATGEAGQPELAQDPSSLNGKYLRLTPDQYHGGPSEPEIVSLGHRNPQGFDWEPETDRLISTEHGPSGGDGPQGYDEINAIEEGNNYGWPVVFDHNEFLGAPAERGSSEELGFTEPIKVYEEAVAPSGATFSGGDYYFATLRGEALHRLRLDGDRVVSDETLLDGEYGRLRTVVEGPDRSLYVLTSNRDGRGDPADSDDRILRVTMNP